MDKYKYIFSFNFKKPSRKNPGAYYFSIHKAKIGHIKTLFGVYKKPYFNINRYSLNLGYIFISKTF